jgi:phage terminase large subunit-like protein
MKWKDGLAYARDVCKGNINVCQDVQKTCQRFINQLENKEWEWQFDPDYAQHILDFAAALCHTKGPDAGKPIVLEPFQIMFICAIYGFRSKRDHSKRMVTDVILFIPRKAGKSTITAIIALYELLCGEKGAEVFTLATNREQATIVFDAAKGFIENMPQQLSSLFAVSKYEVKKIGDTQSMFKALSRDTKKTGDGKNPSCVIIDEAAQITDRNSIEVLHSGMVARANPLRIYITTASFTRETKFYEDMNLYRSMLNGEAKDNPRWFGLLYGPDPQDHWQDVDVWKKVNPMHGISVFDDAIVQRAAEAANKPAALNEFLCKTLNIYVSANAAWIDRRWWDESARPMPTDPPESTFMAFDLAHSRDLNAICTLHRYDEDDFQAEFQFFLPEESLDLVPNHYRSIYAEAVRSGILKLTQGNVTDMVEIEQYISNQCKKYEVKEIGFDPYNAAGLVANLFGNGLPVKKVGQGMAVLSNPSKSTEQAILKRNIHHDGNPFLGWQLGNCEIYTDVNGNVKIRKNEADPSAKVDGIIALIMAMHCHLDNAFVGETFGFRTLEW